MTEITDLGVKVSTNFKLFKADELELGATYRTCFYNDENRLIWPPVIVLVTLVEVDKLLIDCEELPSLHGTIRNIRKDTKAIQRYVLQNG